AFVKLLFPDLEFDQRELKIVVDFAVGMRQRVRDWLHKLSPGEFSGERITYTVRG
ncbi:MAG: BREX system Lon protease-like protein BrxL, partial [Conexivisphaera sp.]